MNLGCLRYTVAALRYRARARSREAEPRMELEFGIPFLLAQNVPPASSPLGRCSARDAVDQKLALGR